MKNIIKVTFLLTILAILAIAQPLPTKTLTSTTLSSAVTTASGTTVVLTSGTGVTIAGPQGQINTVLYVDHELMRVKTLVSGTTYTVERGFTTRPYPHASGAKVWIGSPTQNWLTTDLFSEVAGSCTSANEPSLPRVYVKSAHFYDCLGSQWVLTSGADYPVLGSTVASPAGVMTPTGTIFLVSGTNAVTGVTVPNGFAPGMSLYLIPTAAFTTTTATNIRIASTAVVGKTLILTWDGSKWDPSY